MYRWVAGSCVRAMTATEPFSERSRATSPPGTRASAAKPTAGRPVPCTASGVGQTTTPGYGRTSTLPEPRTPAGANVHVVLVIGPLLPGFGSGSRPALRWRAARGSLRREADSRGRPGSRSTHLMNASSGRGGGTVRCRLPSRSAPVDWPSATSSAADRGQYVLAVEVELAGTDP